MFIHTSFSFFCSCWLRAAFCWGFHCRFLAVPCGMAPGFGVMGTKRVWFKCCWGVVEKGRGVDGRILSIWEDCCWCWYKFWGAKPAPENWGTGVAIRWGTGLLGYENNKRFYFSKKLRMKDIHVICETSWGKLRDCCFKVFWPYQCVGQCTWIVLQQF